MLFGMVQVKKTVLILILICALLISAAAPVFCAAEPDSGGDEQQKTKAVAGTVKAELLVDYSTGERIFGLNADRILYIRDKNDTAFALTTHQNGIVGSDTTLYPSYFIGFKIK